MRIKPAARYKTRAGRRTAVVLYAIPGVPIGILIGAIMGIAATVVELFQVIRSTWRK